MKLSYGTCVRMLVLAGCSVATLVAQEPKTSLRGQVTDPSAASVPGAVVRLRAPGVDLKQQTDIQGRYSFPDLKAGKYTITVARRGFAPVEMLDYQLSGAMTLDFPMAVAVETEKVTVSDDRTAVSVDPNSNAGAIVLRGKDLDALSDDPDQLSEDLQALAGPSAGPNGGQIYIDGFTGGQLPPKSSIREVRINQNPFSAEYDRLGFGRIEIFTKPGADKLRGQFMTMFSDNVFNARNPFVTIKPPFQSKMFTGSVSGPLTKKSSFTVDAEHRGIDEVALVNARVLDSNLTPEALVDSVTTPQARWHVVPRVDLQLTPKNTLTVRYSWTRIGNENLGASGFSLPATSLLSEAAQREYDTLENDHTLQLTETAMLSPKAVNETRVQFMRTNNLQTPLGDTSLPVISVLSSFTAGGPGFEQMKTAQNSWEAQNTTSINAGKNMWKFGGRVRTSNLRDTSPSNFAGTFGFAGGEAPELDSSNQPVLDSAGNPVMIRIDSLEQFRRTQVFLAQGLSAAEIRARGGGASQFTIANGNPLATVSQMDVGLFALDDWRAKPNLTLSYGVRFESQSNIHDHADFSPRLSLAWGMDAKGNRAAKTVLRAGTGIFYDRIDQSLTLQALRFNGKTQQQQQYIVMNPDFYPNVPSLRDPVYSLASQATRDKYADLRTPYILQSAIGVDRQLPRNTSLSVTYTFSRGVHMLRTRNINAPLADGKLPFDKAGSIYLFESTGLMRQNQLITNINTRFSKRVSLFGFYMLNSAKGDTDGVGTFPANSYDLRDEWGSTAFDVRHRVFLGGSVTAPWRLMLSPFITASSGAPFNITTGYDNNGDGIFNDRPAFATDPATPGVVSTPWGLLDPNPKPGEKIIPRNYGRGPAQSSINLRLSHTWGFGKTAESGPGANWTPGGPGGGRGPGGPMMGGRMGGGGRGGPGGMFGDASTGKRYNLTLGVSVRNVFNIVNLSPPQGSITSPLFGQSLSLAGGFGPGGASAASNRRVDMQLRFTF